MKRKKEIYQPETVKMNEFNLEVEIVSNIEASSSSSQTFEIQSYTRIRTRKKIVNSRCLIKKKNEGIGSNHTIRCNTTTGEAIRFLVQY